MLSAEHITQFCLKCYNLCCDDRKTYELIQFSVTFCSNSHLVEFSQIYIKMWWCRHPVSANIKKVVCKELVIMIALTCSVHTKLACVIPMVQQLLLSNRLRVLFNDAFPMYMWFVPKVSVLNFLCTNWQCSTSLMYIGTLVVTLAACPYLFQLDLMS